MTFRLLTLSVFAVAAVLQIAPQQTRAAEAPLTIELAQLAASIEAEDPQLLLLDASSLDRYRLGHIPGAVHVWWQDTMNWNDPVYGTILPPSENQHERVAWLESIGVTPGSNVVVYDNVDGYRAARIVWFLRFLGFNDAALLLADTDDWIANGGRIDRSQNAAESAAAPAVAPQKGWYVSTAEVGRRLEADDTQIVDTRSPDEATNDVDGTLPVGRISSAVSLPWTEFIDPVTGQLLPPLAIAEMAEAAGLDPAEPVILYATYGVDPALTWLALRSAGFTNVAIYDGGWAEWSLDPDRPIDPITPSS